MVYLGLLTFLGYYFKNSEKDFNFFIAVVSQNKTNITDNYHHVCFCFCLFFYLKGTKIRLLLFWKYKIKKTQGPVLATLLGGDMGRLFVTTRGEPVRGRLCRGDCVGGELARWRDDQPPLDAIVSAMQYCPLRTLLHTKTVRRTCTWLYIYNYVRVSEPCMHWTSYAAEIFTYFMIAAIQRPNISHVIHDKHLACKTMANVFRRPRAFNLL